MVELCINIFFPALGLDGVWGLSLGRWMREARSYEWVALHCGAVNQPSLYETENSLQTTILHETDSKYMTCSLIGFVGSCSSSRALIPTSTALGSFACCSSGRSLKAIWYRPRFPSTHDGRVR